MNMPTVLGVGANKGGVGKSVVSALLAASSVRLGLRTALLDLDPSNPDQLSRQRVQFTSVPGRMPTLLDDSYPSSWWSDPETGVQLLPGPRNSAQRTADVITEAGVRMVERARREVDVIVLDMHQVAADAYTKTLVELADVMVCVVDHDPQSREHLRGWLDDATHDVGRLGSMFLPVLDRNEVRLVYSEGVALSRSRSEDAWLNAKADMGPAYRWAGRLGFDDGILTGGEVGDLVRAGSAATHGAALEITAAVLGMDVPDELRESPKRRGLFRRRSRGSVWLELPRISREAGVAKTEVAMSAGFTADHTPLEGQGIVRPSAGLVELRVLGVPSASVDGAVTALADEAMAVVALAALVGPISMSAAAERLGLSKRQTEALSGDAGLVQMDAGLLAKAPGLRVDVQSAALFGDRLADGLDAELFGEALGLLASMSGAPLSVDRTALVWRWAFTSVDGAPSSFEVAVREVENLVAVVASCWSRDPGLASRDTMIATILHVARCVGEAVNPSAVLTAARALWELDEERERWSEAIAKLDSSRNLDQAAVSAVLEALADAVTIRPVVEVPPVEVPPVEVPVVEVPVVEVPTLEAVVWASPTVAAPSVSPDRRVVLRTTGEVRVEGASLASAMCVPFLVAAAGRAMSDQEIADLTGYSKKTASTSFPTGGMVLDRSAGYLMLADGVFTEHAWMANCERLARAAFAAGSVSDARAWLHQLYVALSEVTEAPYARTPKGRTGKRDPWAWVDEFPGDVPERSAAGQQIVGCARSFVDVWREPTMGDVVSTREVSDMLCRVAKIMPWEPLSGLDGRRGSSGDVLLEIAGSVAGSDAAAMDRVVQAARALIQAGTVEPSAGLVAALGL